MSQCFAVNLNLYVYVFNIIECNILWRKDYIMTKPIKRQKLPLNTSSELDGWTDKQTDGWTDRSNIVSLILNLLRLKQSNKMKITG